jgi:hypothetical protein
LYIVLFPSGDDTFGLLARFDVLLISRARAWLALASVESVSSSAAGTVAAFLPLRAPRLRRFCVEALREFEFESSSCASSSPS